MSRSRRRGTRSASILTSCRSGLPLGRGVRARGRDRRGLPRALRPDGRRPFPGVASCSPASIGGAWPRTRSAAPVAASSSGSAGRPEVALFSDDFGGARSSSVRCSTALGPRRRRRRVRRRHPPRPRLRGRRRGSASPWRAGTHGPAPPPSRATSCWTTPRTCWTSSADHRLEHVLVGGPSIGAMPELPLIISVDDHVVEPPTLWTDRLPAEVPRPGAAGGARHRAVQLRGRRVLLREGRGGRRALRLVALRRPRLPVPQAERGARLRRPRRHARSPSTRSARAAGSSPSGSRT